MPMKLLVASICVLFAYMPLSSNAQCKGFSKRNCRPMLENYVHDGKLNFAVMYPGDQAEVPMTFYANQEYRLIICSETFDTTLTYTVMDLERNELYSADGSNEKPFDFSVTSTQQLLISINIEEHKSTDHTMYTLKHNGCVSIMVGLKEE